MELYFPSSFSLKDKRRILESLLDRVRQDMNVSAAEVGHQDRHRLSKISFAVTGSSRGTVDHVFDNLEDLIGGEPTIQVREIDRSIV